MCHNYLPHHFENLTERKRPFSCRVVAKTFLPRAVDDSIRHTRDMNIEHRPFRASIFLMLIVPPIVGVVKVAEYAPNNESWRLLPSAAEFVFKRRSRHLGALAFLLGRTLFRGSINKPIETGKTLILLLYKAAFFHSLGWSRNLLRCRLYLRVIAVQAFLGLIFDLKAGPQ